VGVLEDRYGNDSTDIRFAKKQIPAKTVRFKNFWTGIKKYCWIPVFLLALFACLRVD
jgi:hypothetical protein